jgi:hypothetical protein
MKAVGEGKGCQKLNDRRIMKCVREREREGDGREECQRD